MTNLINMQDASPTNFVEPINPDISLSTPETRRTGDPTIEAQETPLTDHSAKIKIIMDAVDLEVDVLKKCDPVSPTISAEEFVSTTYFNKPFADLAFDLQQTIVSLLQKQMVPGLSQTDFLTNTLNLVTAQVQRTLYSDPDTAHFLSLPPAEQEERMQYYSDVQNDLQTRYPSVFANKSETKE